MPKGSRPTRLAAHEAAARRAHGTRRLDGRGKPWRSSRWLYCAHDAAWGSPSNSLVNPKTNACALDSQAIAAWYCSRVTTERSAVIGDATLTASGIARLANVGRAAVSNWRRRHADFPTPVGGTPTSPLFDA